MDKWHVVIGWKNWSAYTVMYDLALDFPYFSEIYIG